jgi:hypothetical protein
VAAVAGQHLAGAHLQPVAVQPGNSDGPSPSSMEIWKATLAGTFMRTEPSGSTMA